MPSSLAASWLIWPVALTALGGSVEALRAALRYPTVGLLGSLAFLAGVTLIYAAYGTLDMPVLAQAMRADPPTWTALALMSAGLLLKCALFPLYFLAAPRPCQRAGAGQRGPVGPGGKGGLLPAAAPVAGPVRAGVNQPSAWLLLGWLGAAAPLPALAEAHDRRRGFHLRFLTAMGSNFLLILAGDALTFYLGFALMGLSAYGLVAQRRSQRARGRVV